MRENEKAIVRLTGVSLTIKLERGGLRVRYREGSYLRPVGVIVVVVVVNLARVRGTEVLLVHLVEILLQTLSRFGQGELFLGAFDQIVIGMNFDELQWIIVEFIYIQCPVEVSRRDARGRAGERRGELVDGLRTALSVEGRRRTAVPVELRAAQRGVVGVDRALVAVVEENHVVVGDGRVAGRRGREKDGREADGVILLTR